MRTTFVVCVLLLLALSSSAQDAPPKPVDSLSDFKDGKGILAPVMKIEAKLLDECSGIIWHDGAWWAHNDSGDGPNLFRSATPDFAAAEVFSVPGAKAVDWEDITVYGGDLLCCDIGDNGRKREDCTLYRVKLETAEDGARKMKLLASYPVTWPDGAHDCEAAFTIDGKLHLVTKNRGEGTAVYRFDSLTDGKKNTPDRVAKLDVGDKAMITSGCFDAASGNVVLLSYTRAYVYAKDKLAGAPAWSTLLEANQCEAVCVKDGTLYFANEQRDVYAVPEFLKRQPKAMMPPRVKAELPMAATAHEVDGTGASWKAAGAALPLGNIAEGEYLRWIIAGNRVMLAGSFAYTNEFTSSDERGGRMGTGVLLCIGTEPTEWLTGKETLMFMGDNGQVGADAWVLDLAKGIKLVPVKGLAVKGGVKDGRFTFEVSFPITQFFAEGKLPGSILANVWGRNLKGRVEVALAGTSMVSIERPYTWADVTIRQPGEE